MSVRPIPDLSPPTIDSRTALSDHWAFRDPSPFIQGTLAIDFSLRYDAAQDPEAREYFGPQHSLTRDLPEPEAWVRHIAQALVEVMSGARPAPQVIRWTSPEVYAVVARRSAVSGRRSAVAKRALVRTVRICEPVDGVLEACAVVVDNGRVRALAMRVVGVDRRWVVSALQVG
ncbi:MAG: Rv3235 family protein [Actinomycetota bacterium]